MQGQPICSYYSLYGLCKYGPTCRFDHPMDGYNYAYNMSPLAPAYSTPAPAYSPPTPYQRTVSLVPVSDASSPTKASKLSDWIKKGATDASNKHQNLNTKSLEDSCDHSDSLDRSDALECSEVHLDRSEVRLDESD